MASLLALAACGPRVNGPQAARASTAPVEGGDDAAPVEDRDDAAIASAAERGERVYELEGMRIEVAERAADGTPVLISYDAQSLFEQGNDALARGLPEVAVTCYQKLRDTFPDSALVAPATYNLGLAHEVLGAPDRALATYRELFTRPELGRDSVDAHIRAVAVLSEHERWAEARREVDALLARTDLTHADRIQAQARLGYIALSLDDFAAAEAALLAAMEIYAGLTSALDDDYFVAMSRYYLAEIPHRQFLAAPLRLPDAQLARDLDAKAELLALAYDRYARVLDVTEPYWATAAGYQMSQIYKQFWDDIVSAPVPAKLSPEAAGYYRTEVHARVRGMLEKALEGHGRNVELAEVYGTSTEWSEASRVRAGEIARILTREARGELVTPASAAAEIEPSPGRDVDAYVPARVEL
ncbi:tetratricopeptide repeat protein [Haliangium sp.]|uniref:tetratricopeptide repeat protein n=1 Tax=Haliangium sp. TaxID=2663208 RepID=UPI003D0B3233